ncbi:hypothetical protein B0T22DRAFT_514750 [Podospora appendiculata]|uniref:Uncharacterized protein n=1 Tax=Podospora appendiculata TaxID=314037 RepID=A0AAE1CDN6_9PEZI|nr:hypothetical protein B0T22DRAFT_514750 [Podospora appendiculata]
MPINSTNVGNDPTVSGWVYDSGTRGTLDIIYGCVAVLVAAVWTVVHLNVPAKGESDGRVVLRRVRWGLVSVFAPDVLTMVAAAQWVSATESLQQMKELSGTDGWTLVHAFYALSGGFVLQTPDTETFPINAASVHYLVSRGYIALPSITREEIWDKSKADVFAKGLAILQGGWIIIQAIARTAQGLPLTPLELFTLAFVVSTAMSYFFWWRKPQHVGTPTPIECLVPMSKIWADAGYPEDMPYSGTPMDFVEKASQHWKRRSMFENFDLESAEWKEDSANPPLKNGVRVERGHTQTQTNTPNMISSQRPRQRIADDAVMAARLPTKVVAMLMVPSMLHSGIHLAGWNHTFPTSAEQTVWRVCAVVLVAMSSAAVGLVRVLGQAKYRGRYNMLWVWVNADADAARPAAWDVLLGLTTLSLVLARCFLIMEVCISLRQLPARTFVDVDWTHYIPHV